MSWLAVPVKLAIDWYPWLIGGGETFGTGVGVGLGVGVDVGLGVGLTVGVGVGEGP